MGPGWCPYNTFRTSGDIVNEWDRVMSNLMTVVPFLSPDKKHGGTTSEPLSRPGCFACAHTHTSGMEHAPRTPPTLAPLLSHAVFPSHRRSVTSLRHIAPLRSLRLAFTPQIQTC